MRKRMNDEVRETMRGLHDTGVIDKQTLRDFEAQALPPPSCTADTIRSLRERLHIS